MKRKPVWIRVVGWVGILLAVLAAWDWYDASAAAYPPGSVISIMLLAGTSIMLLFLWAIASGLVWLFTRQAQQAARATAAIVDDRLGSSQLRAPQRRVVTSPLSLADHPPAVAPSGPTPESNFLCSDEACDVCTRARRSVPLLHCCRHELNVCAECLPKHDNRVECYYIPAGRAPAVGREVASNA